MSLVSRIAELAVRVAAEFQQVRSEAEAKQLPSQTGHGGKFLQTDGTAASWQTLPVTQAELDAVYQTLSNELSGSSGQSNGE